MLAALDGRCVVAVTPECTLTALAPIVGLAHLSLEQLHARRDLAGAAVANDEMDVVAGRIEIEHTQAESHFRLVEPSPPFSPIPPKPQQELSSVTAVSQVPDMTRQEVPIRTRHGSPPVRPDTSKGRLLTDPTQGAYRYGIGDVMSDDLGLAALQCSIRA